MTVSTQEQANTTSYSIRRLAGLSISSFALTAGLVAALHVLRPEFDPVTRFMSEYAIGEYGYMMHTALVALGIGVGALAYALYLHLSHSWLSRVAVILLAVCSVGVALAGVFETDLQGEPFSTSGLIHAVSVSVGFLAYVAAVWTLAFHFRRNADWQDSARLILGAAVLALVLQVIYWLVPSGWEGLVQRVFTGTVFLTLVYIAQRLRRQANGVVAAEGAW